ncbi:hypothetical protein K490DRAFT_65420 [Saccharata proteae CBS 121410]|uniref:PhoD-like phosphatase metallophosphatase domain-containing protein n=1 Tax=Saccharata proteae CBS 121410 TaxID=1314787 RepID=A0A9P4HX12_9PEZI|nr:hypothetical protein K490DRAFT_65420 [Saccharata proteae CBS 121410]
MTTLSDVIACVTSLVLRVTAFLFLRWIPSSIAPPVAYTTAAIYVVSFLQSFLSTKPYKVVSDEIDIITRETVAQGDEDSDVELIEGAEAGSLEELDVEETVVIEEKDPQILRTLLTGIPSPTSAFWSWFTFAVNMGLLAMMLDLIYRAPLLHQVHDLSFARVGYVSDRSAKILVREPSLYQLPLFVSYRYDDPPVMNGIYHDTAWKSAGNVSWVTDETDYTATVHLRGLMPDTKYRYVLSNNHTGNFVTAPRVGEVSTRAANQGKYTFLHSSCIKPRVPYTPFQDALSIPGFNHLAKWIDKLGAHFMLFLGDFIYVDVPVRQGKSHEDYRREYRQVYASPEWPSVSESLPWIHVLDDHEIDNDWDKNETGVFQAAYDPWIHYQASVNPPPVRNNDTYFSFTQGPTSFFLMDTRRYRSPIYTRDPMDPGKSMLGSQQLQDLLRFLREPVKPGVHWKVIVSSVPFTKNWNKGPSKMDTWGGYLHERRVILEAMWDVGLAGGVGVVVLSGDRHEFAATSFPPPKEGRWPLSATVHEFSTSPLSMFYLPVRTYDTNDEEDVCIKYIPDGTSKFGAVEITNPKHSDQSILTYRLFVDGEETWSYAIMTPPDVRGAGRAKDAIWG